MSENAAETKSLKQMREGWVKGVFNDTHYVDFTGCDWNDEQMAADLQARDKMLADDGYARGYRAAVTAAADLLAAELDYLMGAMRTQLPEERIPGLIQEIDRQVCNAKGYLRLFSYGKGRFHL